MNEIKLIPLDRIRDNPFQARRDYAGIADLARKIADMKAALPEMCGLIHPPTARKGRGDKSDPDTNALRGACEPIWHIELAEGHRRLRAFYMLRDGAPDLAIPADPDYAVMPISLVELTDQAMDDIAWDENTARKDLSPVEEARALQRTIEAFHITQSELADRRRLGRSTVANKLRLLALPDELLQAIHDGRLTERHGMSYLPLVDIPAADLELVKKNLMTNTTFLFGSYWPPHPDTLCKRLLEVNDLTADQVRAIVDKLKLRIEEERRRKWDDTASKGAICAAPASEAIQAAVREAAPRPEDVSRWTGSDGAAQAPGDPTIRYYNRETGEIQDTPPSPDLNSYYGGNMQSPSPTPPSDQPRQSVVSAPTVPDVMISIRILRDADRYPCTFVLKIGDSGMVPATCEGPFEELYGRLTRQLSEHLNMFRPGHCQVPIPEQIIMEPH